MSLIERVEIQLRDKPVLIRTFEVRHQRADAGFRWLDLRIYDDTKPDELRALSKALLAAADEAER